MATAAESPPAGWKLAWNDEFDGDTINRTKWTCQTGNGFMTETGQWVGGWGNGELEFYTDRAENAFVRDGMLHIRAIKEPFKNCRYTSARLTTKGLFQKVYGRFECRAKLPLGKGLWPAFWMLPATNTYGGWAASGELDIMEARGQEPTKVSGTIHYGSCWPANVHSGADFLFPDKTTIAEFHIYALEWEPEELHWYVDDKLYSTQKKWWSSSKVNYQRQGVKPKEDGERNPWPAPFDKPFYLILNLAIGGNFLGNPDTQTSFPAEMVIDYVRVYDKIISDK